MKKLKQWWHDNKAISTFLLISVGAFGTNTLLILKLFNLTSCSLLTALAPALIMFIVLGIGVFIELVKRIYHNTKY